MSPASGKEENFQRYRRRQKRKEGRKQSEVWSLSETYSRARSMGSQSESHHKKALFDPGFDILARVMQ